MMTPENNSLSFYYGDIHNHCGASYGHGPVEDALANARLQLDFVSVTGHGLWPDMPREQQGMERRIKYHEDGFQKLAAGWEAFVAACEAANEEGSFVSFLGYEMHSCHSGDQTVMYRDGAGEVLKTETVPELREKLLHLQAEGTACMTFTHHIGYRQGFRGVNWQEHTDHPLSPFVEIFSMHGCSESDLPAYPYLHSMGPCDHDSTFSAGILLGRIIGCMASTDHHSAHPGSHGHGRVAVLAKGLTRADIWEALMQRRTVALTGDRMEVDFRVNGSPVGEVISSPSPQRHVHCRIQGGAAIRSVEVLKNEKVIEHRYLPAPAAPSPDQKTGRAKVGLEVGWGSRGKEVNWEVSFGISEGTLLQTEPRFKGSEVVSPTDHEEHFRFSDWERSSDRSVSFTTRTIGNPTPVTNSNQGFGLEVEMPLDAFIVLTLNGKTFRHTLREILSGARSGYLSGYGTPCYRLVAAPPESYELDLTLEDAAEGEPLPNGMDAYRVRVEQWNRQWAWTSPVWIKR